MAWPAVCATCPGVDRKFAPPRPGSVLGVVGLLTLLALPSGPVHGQAERKVQGELILIPGELTSELVARLRNDTERAIKQGARTIIYQFQPGEPSKFGPSFDLASYLLDKIEARVTTVAYAERPIQGHAVLAMLACNKIYLKEDAAFGFDQATLDRTPAINDIASSAYMRIADRRGRPVALVLKMLDPRLTVYQFEAEGTKFKLGREQADRLGVDARHLLTVAEENLQPRVFLEPGRHGMYSARDAERAGLISRAVASPQQVVEILGLPGSVLNSNPLLSVDQPRAAVIQIKDEIDRGTVELVLDKVRKAIDRDKVHCIIFEIDNPFGGIRSAEPAGRLANQIVDRAQKANVLTVAYIPSSAKGAAAFLAFACDQMVFGPEAQLDAQSLVFQDAAMAQPIDEDNIKPVRLALMDLAEKQGYPTILARGLMDLNLEIIMAQERADERRPAGEEPVPVFMARGDVRNNWVPVEGAPVIKKPGTLLVIDAKQAVNWGIARAVLQNKDIRGVYGLYGINERDVQHLRADWLDKLVFLLRHQVTTVLLVIIGFTCMILELKSPGLTVPGIIAAVCFLLIFWAHTWLAGEVNALAILLFILGIVLLGVEIFILPGFGVTGISGIVLMLLGLALLVIRQWPTSQSEYIELGYNFTVFAGGLVAAMFGAYTLARYLPNIPYANRLILKSPTAEDEGDAETSLPPPVPPSLLGQIGTAVTALRPAGKACFGDEYIDITAEGGYIEAGTRVQVIEIDGLKVVVKAV